METITVQVLRDDTDGVLQRVEAGEAFTVTRDGRAFAQIRPVQAERQRFRADLDAVVDPWLDAR